MCVCVDSTQGRPLTKVNARSTAACARGWIARARGARCAARSPADAVRGITRFSLQQRPDACNLNTAHEYAPYCGMGAWVYTCIYICIGLTPKDGLL